MIDAGVVTVVGGNDVDTDVGEPFEPQPATTTAVTSAAPTMRRRRRSMSTSMSNRRMNDNLIAASRPALATRGHPFAERILARRKWAPVVARGRRPAVGETLGMVSDNLDLEAVIQLETQVWEALRHGDAAADAALLSDDFLGVYPTGFADRSDHAGELADGPTVAEYELHDARIMVLSDSDVLLAYRADWRRLVEGELGEPESMYVSSLWSRRGREWRNVFSQDCPAER